jgi:hypothetical protein
MEILLRGINPHPLCSPMPKCVPIYIITSRRCIHIIITITYTSDTTSECPANFTSQTMGKVAADPKTRKVTEDTLAALRGRLYSTKNAYEMAHGKVCS